MRGETRYVEKHKAVRTRTAPGNADKLVRKKILHERALFYAKERTPLEDPAQLRDFLVFSLAFERYAFQAAYVREVLSLTLLTFLPGIPPFIAGITHVRGRIISVIDLKRLFHLPERGITEFNKIIILSNGGMELGILADEIEGIISIRDANVHPVPPTMKEKKAEFISGITEEKIIILDTETILGSGTIKGGIIGSL